ncbi:MAG: polymer-forming cytoskeletal protein [Verrucomicrobia bacterium]|nr:polymer-forming cytoskeletal protein [Verrucomicrobiota bacterium]
MPDIRPHLRHILPAALLVFLAGMPLTTRAVTFTSTNDFLLPAGASLAEETWMLTGNVEIHGSVDNDLFILGEKLLFPGTFEKSVWALGDDITLSGTAHDDARLLARSVTVGGRISDDLMAGGNDVKISSNCVIEGSAFVFAENAVVVGHIAGDLTITAYEVTLGGDIGGKVEITAQDIVVLPGARIGGDIVYRSSGELFLDKSVILNGSLRRQTVPAPSMRRSILMQASFLFGALALGLPFMALFSGLTNRSINLLRHAAWRCALTGTIAFCIVPMVAFAAFFTIFGIPLCITLVLFFTCLLFVSKIIVALTLGAAIMRYRGALSFAKGFSALFIGLLFLYIVAMVPTLGMVVWLSTAMFGLGALLLAIFGARLFTLIPSPQPGQQAFPSSGPQDFKEPSLNEDTNDNHKE